MGGTPPKVPSEHVAHAIGTSARRYSNKSVTIFHISIIKTKLKSGGVSNGTSPLYVISLFPDDYTHLERSGSWMYFSLLSRMTFSASSAFSVRNTMMPLPRSRKVYM